jgi:hypothetical protein
MNSTPPEAAIVRVLELNSARQFYEHLGPAMSEAMRSLSASGHTTEIWYGWDDLRALTVERTLKLDGV